MTNTQVGQWRATYVAGSWMVLAGPQSMIIMPPAPAAASQLLNDLWSDLLAAASMAELAEKLAGYRIDSVPDFAAFFWVDGQMRSLVRGDLQVVDLDAGERLEIDPTVQTWQEIGLGDVRRVRIDMEYVDQNELVQLPLVVGAVSAAAVVLDASQPAVTAQLAGSPAPDAAVDDDAPVAPVIPMVTPTDVDAVEESESTPTVDVEPGHAPDADPAIETSQDAPAGEPTTDTSDEEVVDEPVEEEASTSQPDAADPDDAVTEQFAAAAPTEQLPTVDAPTEQFPQPSTDLDPSARPDVAEAQPPAPPVAPVAPQPESSPLPPQPPAPQPGFQGSAPPPAPPGFQPSAPPSPAQQAARPPAPGQPSAPQGPGGGQPPMQPGMPGPAAARWGQPQPPAGAPGQPPPPAGQWGQPPQQTPPPPGLISSVPDFGRPQQTPPPARSAASAPNVDDDDDEGTVFATGIARTHKASGNPGQDSSLVMASFCPQQHMNSADARSCRICGAPMPPQNGRLVTRPVLAVLRPSSGQPVGVDRTVLIGRSPTASRVARDQLPHLMTVPSPGQDISRTHLQVGIEDWDIVVTDLFSTNGSTLIRPRDGERERLQPGEATIVELGSVLDLGDGITILIDHP